jgi:hypothetical protein
MVGNLANVKDAEEVKSRLKEKYPRFKEGKSIISAATALTVA